MSNPGENIHPSIQDLPDSEAQLFQLDKYLLLDVDMGVKNLGNVAVLRDLLQLMIDEAIPEDETLIQQAHTIKNWEQIENLAHKMKSGAIYCGTSRMQHACQYLERYCKAGHFILREELYQQLLLVVDETKRYIKNWLGTVK